MTRRSEPSAWLRSGRVSSEYTEAGAHSQSLSSTVVREMRLERVPVSHKTISRAMGCELLPLSTGIRVASSMARAMLLLVVTALTCSPLTDSVMAFVFSRCLWPGPGVSARLPRGAPPEPAPRSRDPLRLRARSAAGLRPPSECLLAGRPRSRSSEFWREPEFWRESLPLASSPAFLFLLQAFVLWLPLFLQKVHSKLVSWQFLAM